MNAKRFWTAAIAAALLAAMGTASGQSPVGTAFTYQGALKENGTPVTGSANFRFTLWDDPSVPTTSWGPVTVPGNVQDGLFTVVIDFGVNPWTANQARWLEIEVEYPTPGTFVPLAPWQELTPTAFSLSTRGMHVDAADNVGLGTATPAEKLHVDGNVLATGTLQSGTSILIDGTTDTITASSGTVTFPDTSVLVTNANILTAPGPALPGWIGIGQAAPYTTLHVNNCDIPQDFSTLLYQEDVVGEDSNTWMGLYSEAVGGWFSSGITLAELRTANFDKWSIFRTDDPNTTELRVTFGDQVDPHGNDRMMSIWEVGDTLLAPVRGDVGIGFEGDPLGKLHVITPAGPFAASTDIEYEDVLIEDRESAILGLYCDSDQGLGAGIVLAEIDPFPVNSNRWGIYRRKSSNVGDLNFTFGSDTNPGANPKVLQLTQDCDVIASGEIYKRYTSNTKDPAAPLAYGCVSDDAVPVLTAKTANVDSVTWDPVNERYEIEVSGVTLDINDHTILVTTNGRFNPTIATTYTSAGTLWVTCWNTNTGSKIQQDFSFLIYEANH